MNVWLMKTYKSWADQFLKALQPFVAIDEEGINTHYGSLSMEQRDRLFARLQRVGASGIQYGLLKRFFDEFYDCMAQGDIIILGTGQRTQFNTAAVLQVAGPVVYSDGVSPRHRRDVRIIWTGSPFPVPEWGFSRRLEHVNSLDRYSELVQVLVYLLQGGVLPATNSCALEDLP